MRVAFTQVIGLAPEMFVWLAARYLEHRSVTGIVDGFERFLASRGLAQVPDPVSPPAIVFVDLSGFHVSPANAAMSPPSTSPPRSNVEPMKPRGDTAGVS